ncbi:MAG: hypothetical protein PVF73_02270 [Bacteroidales bacterium]|jgi:hypothetical protein
MILKDEEKNILTGIVATVGIHLLVLIVFMLARLDKVHNVHKEPIVIEFDEELYKTLDQMMKEEKVQESKAKTPSDQDLKNIAVNTSEQILEKISTEKYIEQLKDELDIEDLNQQLDRSVDEPVVEAEQKKDVAEKGKKYTGPTRIEYSLKNRTDRFIHIPVYKCQHGGRVVIDIVVNQEGEVISASVASSSTDEICIIETALNSARISLFNIDMNAEPKQRGTISYEFVSQ